MEIDDTILTAFAKSRGWIDRFGTVDEDTGETINIHALSAPSYAVSVITNDAKSHIARTEGKKASDTKIEEVIKDPQIFTKYNTK